MDELKHYGVKGMHWGVRRYQNYDGTRIGAKRRQSGGGFWDDAKKKTNKKSVVVKSVRKEANSRDEKAVDYAADKMKKKDYSKATSDEVMSDWFKYKKEFKNSKEDHSVVKKNVQEARKKENIEKANKEFHTNVANNYSEALESITRKHEENAKKIEAQYDKKDLKFDKNRQPATKEAKEYIQKLADDWKKTYSEELLKTFGESPKEGKEWVKDSMYYVYEDAYYLD